MNWQGARKAITQASSFYMTTPNPDEGRGGGFNNNNMMVRALEAGMILNAVYNQPEDRKCWLLFAYSEIFTMNEVKALNLYCLANVLKIYQEKYGQIKPKKMYKSKVAITRAIYDFKLRVNSQTKIPVKELAVELCSQDNWHREFGKIHRVTQYYLDELDAKGLVPVRNVIDAAREEIAA